MIIDILTIFPEFFASPFQQGILRRAQEAGLLQIETHDLRRHTHDRHRTVDDRPFGGAEGMVLRPEPFFRAAESIWEQGRPRGKVILLSAQGKLFRQPLAAELAKEQCLMLLCGRYEGVDERVAEHLAGEEISIGDFVLSGGELAAAVVVDAVTRLLPGALGNAASAVRESFAAPPGERGVGLLDCPQYTRPASFREMAVPDVLLCGDHQRVDRWRRRKALEKTRENRPDLLSGLALNAEQQQWLAEFAEEKRK